MSEPKRKPPKSVLDMIILAIRQQPGSASSNGVSRVAIAKYLKSELQWEGAAKLKQAFKKGVDTGKLEQTGQSFRIKGDPTPDRPPEAQVQIEDVKDGSGPQAARGDTVVVKYEGKLADESVFDAAPSFEFTLGAGDVIKGWDQGIVGMKVGGVRKLHVPAKLGYGKRGAAPEIPPNADLFFTVTLKKIK
jgi:FKBP-type peptidyl-prolyl cis-trans isomerase